MWGRRGWGVRPLPQGQTPAAWPGAWAAATPPGRLVRVTTLPSDRTARPVGGCFAAQRAQTKNTRLFFFSCARKQRTGAPPAPGGRDPTSSHWGVREGVSLAPSIFGFKKKTSACGVWSAGECASQQLKGGEVEQGNGKEQSLPLLTRHPSHSSQEKKRSKPCLPSSPPCGRTSPTRPAGGASARPPRPCASTWSTPPCRRGLRSCAWTSTCVVCFFFPPFFFGVAPVFFFLSLLAGAGPAHAAPRPGMAVTERRMLGGVAWAGAMAGARRRARGRGESIEKTDGARSRLNLPPLPSR